MIKDILQENEHITPNSKQIAVLKEHFPSCFNKDGVFDIEKFKSEIKEQTAVSQEGYELNFLGKSYAKLLASTDTTTVIKPNEAHNALPENENSENIYISGDNLDGLKHLLKSYNGAIKCIYIDPPYNTGSDGFVYQDNFNYSKESLVEKLSVSEEEADRILDLTKRGSASHSAWLMFIYSRLVLARDLLTEEGVIFISIDDNEQANLKLLCDEVFGEENFIGNLPTIMNLKGNNDEFGFSGTHEYTIVYCLKKDKVNLNDLQIDEEDLEENWEMDEDGFFKKGRNILATSDDKYRESRPYCYYPFLFKNERLTTITKNEFDKIYNKEQNKFDDDYVNELKLKYENEEFQFILPINNNNEHCRWAWSFDGKIKNKINDLIVTKTKNGFSLNVKQRPELGELPSKKPKSTLYKPNYSSSSGTNEVKRLFNKKVFSNPKPVKLLKDLIEIGSSSGDTILDFFSGSGTCAQAVLELNNEIEKSQNRRFISIQLQEPIKNDSIQNKIVYDYLIERNLPLTLDYVGIERLKLVIKELKSNIFNSDLDLGFKHFILEEPNAQTLDKLESFDPTALILDSSILKDFGKPTILTTWLNADGYGLTAKPEVIDLAGYEAYYIQKHLYLIDPGFNLESMKVLLNKYDSEGAFNPENLVLFGYSFPDWSINEMMEKNLKILNDGEKNLKINFSVRY